MIQLGWRPCKIFPLVMVLKLLRLIKICVYETYSRVRVGKHLSIMFPIKTGLKQDALSPLIFNFALEYAIWRVQVNQDDVKFNDAYQLLVYADDVDVLGGSVLTMKKHADALVDVSKDNGLEVNAERSKYMIMSRDQNSGQNRNIKLDNKSFERVEQPKYLVTSLTN